MQEGVSERNFPSANSEKKQEGGSDYRGARTSEQKKFSNTFDVPKQTEALCKESIRKRKIRENEHLKKKKSKTDHLWVVFTRGGAKRETPSKPLEEVRGWP